MSKIGKMPIQLPDQIEVKLKGFNVSVKGPKGELNWQLPKGIKAEQLDSSLKITRNLDTKEAKSLHGLSRSKIANMVHGVTLGWSKVLEIFGVGFKAELKDKNIILHMGFSHPAILSVMPGAEINITKNEVVVSGIDKEIVGEMAARIRAVKKPEPYKGKGIKYKDEVVRRKAGKAAKTAAI